MKAKDVMTHRVVSISEKATVLDAAQLMMKRRISGLPVVDANGNLVGMITEGDLLRRTELATEKTRNAFLRFLLHPGRVAEEYTHSHGRFIGEVMTPDPVSVSEDTSLDQVVTLLEKKRIRRVPVLRDGQLVGIVTRANLIKAFVKNAQYPSSVNATDSGIRSAIVAEMDKNAWAPTAAIDVSVAAGVVTLSGTIFDERDRGALKVLAENVPGVREVHDDLIWVEPYSGVVIEGMDGVGTRTGQ
jgi:CBS domain-containing protein